MSDENGNRGPGGNTLHEPGIHAPAGVRPDTDASFTFAPRRLGPFPFPPLLLSPSLHHTPFHSGHRPVLERWRNRQQLQHLRPRAGRRIVADEMVTLAPRETSPPSGSMGRHLNPRPNMEVSNVNVPAVAVVIAAQSVNRHPRRTAQRRPSVPTACTRRDGYAVNSRSTATAASAAPRPPRKRRERRRRWPPASRRPGPMRQLRTSTIGWRQWLLRRNLATPTTRRTRSPGKPRSSAANCHRWNRVAERGMHGRPPSE